MTRLARALLALLVVVLLVHVWSTLVPSHDNWGFHFFAFYDGWIAIAALLLSMCLFIPQIQARWVPRLESVLRKLAGLPLIVLVVLLGLLLYGAIQLFMVKLHLLGDSAILLRSVSLGITGEEI